MAGVSKSGYYAWKARMEDKDGRQAAKRQEENELKEIMKEIIRKLGYVPGKKGFHTYFWRDYGKSVSVKRCKRLMNEMNLTPNKPHKDAYKHQATHNHPCAAPVNHVNQEFNVGPRRVILTDITYLYYGKDRAVFYLCAFKDAYTKEILGHSISKKMNTDLVKQAYNNMMEKHKNEFPKNKYDVYIHSDQGSQYLSTTFKQILSDDKFVQSVSGRGNSQDNAPMESFFNRLKTNILDLVALCDSFEVAVRLVNGYLDDYNNKHYQYNLAGLTPAEFYQYITTGIYPLDNYYGVKADEMRTIEELVNDRRKAADEKNKKVREARIKRNEERNKLNITPVQQVGKDQKKLNKAINELTTIKEMAIKQINKYEAIFEKTKTAAKFLLENKQLHEELMIPSNWQNHEELNYVFDMNEMF